MTQSSTADFSQALASLQHVLIARRVLASDEGVRLNWQHFNIMLLLHEKGIMRPSGISTVLGLSRSTTAKRLTYMEKHRLVIKVPSEEDGRSHGIELDSMGRQIIGNILNGQEDNGRLAMSALSLREQKQFMSIAPKIVRALDSSSLKSI